VTYLDPDLVTDEGANAEAILAALADKIDGWSAAEAHLETVIAEAVGIVTATCVQRFVSEARNDYAGFGENTLQIIRTPAGTSNVLAKITGAPSAAGKTITGGYTFVITTPGGEPVAFATTQDVTFPAVGTMEILDVPSAALEPGPEPNGATGAAIQRDDHADVTGVIATTIAAGGSEQEELAAYNAKVRARAELLHPLVTPESYAAVALDTPGIAFAYAQNRRDPATGEADAPGHIRIRVADSNGGDPGVGPRNAYQAFLDSVDHVMAATAHVTAFAEVTVDITASVQAAPEYSDAEAEAAAETAIQNALKRNVWNHDPDAKALYTPRRTSLGVYDVAALIDDLPQVLSVVDVTINGAEDPITVAAYELLAADDVTVTAV